MSYLWLQIAKNEIRLWSSRYRKNRKLFFIILAVFMGTYAFVLVPFILNLFSNGISSLLLGFGPSLPYLMYYIFSFIVLYIFLWCITFPLSSTLQSTSDLSGQLEILLSSPVKPRHILFGKFIGRLPTYLIMLFALAPWLINFFNIALPLTVFGQILIYMTIFAVIVFGMWLGTLLAAFVESKIRKSEKSRDYSKAMTFLITIFTVAIMYSMIWVVSTGLTDPSSPLYSVLQFFPSTWGSIIVISIFGYSSIAPLHVGFYILLLLGFTVLTLFLGYHGSGRFYTLEPSETGTERIVGEKRFYRFFRRLLPRDFGVQFISQLKQFSRKMENFSRIGYSVGISAIILIFNLGMGVTPYPPFVITMITYFYPMMIASLLGCFVIIGSKDHLWIYKKAPNGVRNYVRTVYLVNILYSLMIGVAYSIVASIIFGLTFLETLLALGLFVVFLLTLMAMAIGIAFIFPTFEERGAKVGIIMMSFIGITIGIMIGSVFAGDFLLNDATYGASVVSLILTTIIGIALLRLGIKKLSALE
ncbi:MAG: ABC transporter permease [Promethearchaeota archaeon]